MKQLRSSGSANVHEFRLRHLDADFNRQIDFNVAGLMNVDTAHDSSDLWLWNLACEGQMIDSDFDWLPLIAALHSEVVIVFRGSLESIIRPAMVLDGDWPWWVPQSWRNYAAMDPRCYFSTTWWRKAKQTSVDSLKQKARLKLLNSRPGEPLMHLEILATCQTELIKQLRALGTRVLVLGLLPVDQACFPGSAEYFKIVNERLGEISEAEGAEFFDWGSQLNSGDLFYRDGFHPNATGATELATLLHNRLCKEPQKGTKVAKTINY
ncbi:MAG TPA: SGNH/GDSL hydrolase family protein, partial [Pyrinomonadaceae bacterium]